MLNRESYSSENGKQTTTENVIVWRFKINVNKAKNTYTLLYTPNRLSIRRKSEATLLDEYTE